MFRGEWLKPPQSGWRCLPLFGTQPHPTTLFWSFRTSEKSSRGKLILKNVILALILCGLAAVYFYFHNPGGLLKGSSFTRLLVPRQ